MRNEKHVLDKNELYYFIKIFREHICSIKRLKNDYRGELYHLEQEREYYTLIENPKLSAIFSESFVIYLIKDKNTLEINNPNITREIDFGTNLKRKYKDKLTKKASDVMIYEFDVSKNDGEFIYVEVKGTQERKFGTIKEKDCAADYLIWLDFNDYFADNSVNNHINIYIFQNLDPKVILKGMKGTEKTLDQIISKIRNDIPAAIITMIKARLTLNDSEETIEYEEISVNVLKR